jgi:hypothetical protein
MGRKITYARLLVGLALPACALCGCAGGSAQAGGSASERRAALQSYVRQIEPLRLAVNRLLEGADPILSGYRDRHLSSEQAARRMGALERRFAAYALDVAAIRPATPALRQLHDPYAHTYVLEDSYLSALATGLAGGHLDELPDTQSIQRAAIIQWRIGLELLARRAALALPVDIQTAGRGEIRPSPNGS